MSWMEHQKDSSAMETKCAGLKHQVYFKKKNYYSEI